MPSTLRAEISGVTKLCLPDTTGSHKKSTANEHLKRTPYIRSRNISALCSPFWCKAIKEELCTSIKLAVARELEVMLLIRDREGEMKEKQLGFLIPQSLHIDSVVMVLGLPCTWRKMLSPGLQVFLPPDTQISYEGISGECTNQVKTDLYLHVPRHHMAEEIMCGTRE